MFWQLIWIGGNEWEQVCGIDSSILQIKTNNSIPANMSLFDKAWILKVDQLHMIKLFFPPILFKTKKE